MPFPKGPPCYGPTTSFLQSAGQGNIIAQVIAHDLYLFQCSILFGSLYTFVVQSG